MTPEEREELRLALIRWLATKPLRYGSPARYLAMCAKSEVWPDVTIDEINAQLEYLAGPTNPIGKPLVEEVAKLSPENRSWKITSAGSDFAAQRGLDRI
jgi:hypothetical protein